MWKTMTTDSKEVKEIRIEWQMVETDEPFSGNKVWAWQEVPVEYTFTTWDETDAIIGQNQADLKGAIRMFKSAGANHQEVRNHPSSKIIFDNLFKVIIQILE